MIASTQMLAHQRTLLLVYLHLHVKVYARNEYIGEDVKGADAVEDIGVFKGDLFRCLHHKSGLVSIYAIPSFPTVCLTIWWGCWFCEMLAMLSTSRRRVSIHLRADGHFDGCATIKYVVWSMIECKATQISEESEACGFNLNGLIVLVSSGFGTRARSRNWCHCASQLDTSHNYNTTEIFPLCVIVFGLPLPSFHWAMIASSLADSHHATEPLMLLDMMLRVVLWGSEFPFLVFIFALKSSLPTAHDRWATHNPASGHKPLAGDRKRKNDMQLQQTHVAGVLLKITKDC